MPNLKSVMAHLDLKTKLHTAWTNSFFPYQKEIIWNRLWQVYGR